MLSISFLAAELAFTILWLLSDPELQVITAYDVLKPPKDDKPSKSVSRSTYLIDEDGIIVNAFGAVKAKENPAQMLEVL